MSAPPGSLTMSQDLSPQTGVSAPQLVSLDVHPESGRHDLPSAPWFEEIAKAASTITYELFCRLTGRVKYRYEE